MPVEVLIVGGGSIGERHLRCFQQIGCGQVQGAFVTSDRQGGDHYLELSFVSGSLAGGAQTGEIQARFNKEDWAVYDESNDFSFDPTKTAFADWNRVTLYRNGTLVWGVEPVPAGPDFSLSASPATVNTPQAGTGTTQRDRREAAAHRAGIRSSGRFQVDQISVRGNAVEVERPRDSRSGREGPHRRPVIAEPAERG